jgi:hypothetical protein
MASARLRALGKMSSAVLATLFPPLVHKEDLAETVGYIEISASPVGSLVPEYVGQTAFDTVNKVYYRAVALTNADWAVDGGTGNSASLSADINLFGFGSGGLELGLTAHAGGTQAAALALSATKSFHEVTTVGSAADSVSLPLCTGSGKIHWVKNSAAANSMQVFGAGTDTIDQVATATGVAVAAGKSRAFIDTATAPAGRWESLLGA